MGDCRPGDPAAYLIFLGVAPSAAKWITDYIELKGHLLKQWNADERACQLACTLHQGAWFSVDGLSTVITSRTGGRQGCTLGMTTFNSAYTVALDMLAFGLKQHEITLVVQVPTAAFWSAPVPCNTECTDVIHATFVDDECCVLMAESPLALDKAIAVLLEVLVPTFSNMHLAINWAPGKTEALLMYRGKHAVRCREQWRQPNGKLAIPVPGHPCEAISIVGAYKYLGSYLAATGETFRNTQHCVQKASMAYAPLAVKVFGSSLISITHKPAFLRHFHAHSVQTAFQYPDFGAQAS